MPFALHHFDRAATMGILANMAVTPIISFWAAPSAAGALVASVLGWQDPFLVSLAASLERVVWVAEFASTHSPSTSFPPVTAPVLVFFALAIAAYSLLNGMGRLLCIPLIMAALAGWSQTQRPVAHITSNGDLYLQAGEGWRVVEAWRTHDALPPLMLDGPVSEIGCPDNRRRCRVELEFGVLELGAELPDQAPEGAASGGSGSHCTTPLARLQTHGHEPRSGLVLTGCDFGGGKSSQIYLTTQGWRISRQTPQTGRPWSPPPKALNQ